MTRQETKAIMPIIQAYAEGKVIQYSPNRGNTWYDVAEDVNHDINTDEYEYRIKPTPKYRPFANAEECWQEMQKHQPFGWVKDKDDGHYVFISYIDTRDGISFSRSGNWSFADVDKYYIFADGSVFGIEES